MIEICKTLYKRSKNNETFSNLMKYIISEKNIRTSCEYVNTLKKDKICIENISNKLNNIDTIKNIFNKAICMSYIGEEYNLEYKKIISLPSEEELVLQQSIRQILEPICDAKFSNNSYGYRKLYTEEHAIARAYKLLQLEKKFIVLSLDVYDIFEKMNQTKIFKQLWSFGIRDRKLLYIMRSMIQNRKIKYFTDNHIDHKNLGFFQFGLLSPLILNLILNEFDRWIESQWESNPIALKFKTIRKDGRISYSNGYRYMRNKTSLKEMHLVRFADSIRIFCKDIEDAKRSKFAILNWFKKRLKIKIEEERITIIDTRKKFFNFLNYKIRVHDKSKKLVVSSYMSDFAFKYESNKLKNLIKLIQHSNSLIGAIKNYNRYVIKIHKKYCFATNISKDCNLIGFRLLKIRKNRLSHFIKLIDKGRKLKDWEVKQYGLSKQLRYDSNTKEPIYPIGYIRCRNPMNRKKDTTMFS